MRTTSLLTTLCLVAVLPLPAFAADRCAFSAARDADLDLAGVKTVVFDIGPYTLDLRGADRRDGVVHGKACASDAKRLATLTISQHREGDRLIVRADRPGWLQAGSWSGDQYSDLTLDAAVPGTIAVQVRVGSGDAKVSGVASLAADVGSGELDARHVRDTLFADVGSGDIVAEDIGTLQVVSVGSGDLKAAGIRGGATVGGVHSGDLSIRGASGDVRIESIGSGDAKVADVTGDVTVQDIGSGDLQAVDVRGDLVVSSVGSGSVDHRGIAGQVRIPADD
jgi:hypothetical protein